MKVLTWVTVLQTGMFVSIIGHANLVANENQLSVQNNYPVENTRSVAKDIETAQPQILILPHHDEFVEVAEPETLPQAVQAQPLMVTPNPAQAETLAQASKATATVANTSAEMLSEAVVTPSSPSPSPSSSPDLVAAEIASVQQPINPENIRNEVAAVSPHTASTDNSVTAGSLLESEMSIEAVVNQNIVADSVASAVITDRIDTTLQATAPNDLTDAAQTVPHDASVQVNNESVNNESANIESTIIESANSISANNSVNNEQTNLEQLQKLSQTLDQSAATVVVPPLSKAEIKKEHELALKQRQAQTTQPVIELNNSSLLLSQKSPDLYRSSGRTGSSWIERAPLPANIGRVSSSYGTRVMGGRSENHTGLDLAAPTGTPIYATGSGLVTKAGWGNGYGQYVEINHGNGYLTRYGHASRIHVQVGQRVNAGDHIANVGCTGRCTGPHLHYEVVKDGQRRNPSVYLALLP